MPNLKLHYFNAPGRAEGARLILAYGGIPWEEVHPEWPAAKAKFPFGQVPVLEVDGKMLAQSGAIYRYCAKLAALMPDDPWALALGEQAFFTYGELFDAFVGPFYATPAEQRAEKVKELLAGPAAPKLANLEKLLASNPGKFVTGDHVSWIDLFLFTSMASLTSGFFGGIGLETLDPYPHIKAHHAHVGNLPKVLAYYEKQGDARAASFRPAAI